MTLTAQDIAHFLPGASYGTPGQPSYWTVAGDFNGDGIADFAAPDGAIANNILGFHYALGRAEGGYGAVTARPVGAVTTDIRTADFNRDGRTDVVAATAQGVAVLLGTAAGGFTLSQNLAAAITPNIAMTADFNGDGAMDVVAGGTNGFAVWLGAGDGTFAAARLLPQLTAPFWIVTGDFNSDGKADFVGQNGTSSASYLGNGDGTFQAPVATMALPWGAQLLPAAPGGYPGIVYQTAQPRQDGSNFTIAVARGVGNGQFVTSSSWVFADSFKGLAVGDFDADGSYDFATRLSGTGTLRVFRQAGGAPILDVPVPVAGALLAMDVDRNGSADLVWGSYGEFFVFRNTHGRPPLLAQVKMTPGAVTGGAGNVTGAVTLGGPAPAGGAVVTLESSDATVFFPGGNTVRIEEGTATATFAVATGPVAEARAVTISGTWSGVTQRGRLDVVAPYSLTGLAVNPGAQYGIFTVTGTVTLSGPADGEATVLLSSGNAALAVVPLAVTVPAGATSANFPVTLAPVAADTMVTIAANLGGVTSTTGIMVLKAQDAVQASRVTLTQKTAELRVEATSTSAVATLTVVNPATGALLGTLRNNGGGKYSGTMTVPLTVTQVRVKSSLGGFANAAVTVK